MVQPPYWVAARLYGVAAPGDGTSSLGHARISGSYTLHTGKDLDDLPPYLFLDAVEAWQWERFTKQEQADRWQAALHAPPVIDVTTIDITRIAMAEAARAGEQIEAIIAGEADPEPDAPPGWDNATLVAQQRVVGIVMD